MFTFKILSTISACVCVWLKHWSFSLQKKSLGTLQKFHKCVFSHLETYNAPPDTIVLFSAHGRDRIVIAPNIRCVLLNNKMPSNFVFYFYLALNFRLCIYKISSASGPPLGNFHPPDPVAWLPSILTFWIRPCSGWQTQMRLPYRVKW